ncbi:uncharacterized protein LOC124494263 [Dermatophagoides farinae]|uniref:MAM domain-containing protein n=1 Tax=Dermatophagoides farinae TaxID=6954 RepID=A0A922HUC7_DERFA|nr:uncharacterized protein LOC124494263 [Dermatophagoides farinae]KAH7643552.1 hypothetical protein HUG17_5914 [Dermatophagoides farinae]KAH9506399.1 hypothetical protein DERF_011135 [Dermatophagoides farinae]
MQRFQVIKIFIFFIVMATMIESIEPQLFYPNQSRSPYAIDNIRWDCHFEVDACHFRNQHNLAQFNRYYNPRQPLFGRRGLLLLNLRSPRVQRYPGARLITHYYPAAQSKACIFLSYYTTGDGPQSFFVIQQDKENKCIFADHDVQNKPNQWNEIEIQLDLSDGDPRFFLETHFQQGKFGFFAIDKFSFGYGQCKNPSPNYC